MRLDNDGLKVKMKKKIKIGLTIGLSIVTIFLLALTIYRWTWDYSENGNYFDEDTMTTYDNDAVPVFAILTIIFSIPTLLLLNSLRKAHNRHQSL